MMRGYEEVFVEEGVVQLSLSYSCYFILRLLF
jgi:hypothetical protein